MAEKPETKFKNKVRPQLEKLSYSWWVKIQQTALVGTPDFLGCVNGVFVAIELKADKKGKVSQLQRYNLDRIIAARGVALVVSPENWDETYDFLKTLTKV